MIKKNGILDSLGSIGAFFIGILLFIGFIGWCGYWFFDACKYGLIPILEVGVTWTGITILSLFMVSGILYIGFKVWEFWIKPFVDLIYKDCIKTPHLKAGIYKKTVNIPTELSFPLPFGKPITRKTAIKVAKQIQRKAEKKRKA